MALGVVGLGMLVMIGLLALRGGAPSQQALLYADLDLREAGQITDALDRAHIPHQEMGSGDRILVPSAEVARARMLLAKDGLPSGGSIGYEIFDRGDSLTSNQFQQDINETRAMEGELARSIRMLQGVRNARVHLVLPKRQPFSRDVQQAQASVMLTMAGSARLDPQGVQAVLNLVAAAVPGLKPTGIAIIDSRGNLLARAGQPTGDEAVVQTEEELHRATELRLSRAVEEMLEQSLGPGHVRAEAAVTMNYDKINETNESFDPNQQVVRSTQTSTDKSNSTETEKTTTVANNLPNADAAGGQTGSKDDKQDETTNYEIGKTVRTIVREQPQIARISLAVMVDGKMQPGKDNKLAWTERNADELARIKRLVQSAIGFDEKRGDTVEVVSMKFAADDEGAATAAEGFLGFTLEKADFISIAQSAILAVVVLIALLVVLRPMALRLASLGPGGALLTADGDALLMGADGVALALPGGVGGGGALMPVAGGTAMLADESPESAQSVEAQLRASAMRKIAELVEQHPEATLGIMRSWMAADKE